ncbi:hypothetical protein LMH87_001519 [Akanthomyces muscarius]|uniref:Uncharacterized protein n=1 Tax=Akanthomyces muscarius TaxID=2231603 RepID=A0A9W8Q6X2_AKAMU|nr:hypothetical protein LMH87_001519 [Akanthomyces muscarius]KAJ4146966.1 hypothetical protein LMH87_001519 [Akanthomyces muscarius]
MISLPWARHKRTASKAPLQNALPHTSTSSRINAITMSRTVHPINQLLNSNHGMIIVCEEEFGGQTGQKGGQSRQGNQSIALERFQPIDIGREDNDESLFALQKGHRVENSQTGKVWQLRQCCFLAERIILSPAPCR